MAETEATEGPMAAEAEAKAEMQETAQVAETEGMPGMGVLKAQVEKEEWVERAPLADQVAEEVVPEVEAVPSETMGAMQAMEEVAEILEGLESAAEVVAEEEEEGPFRVKAEEAMAAKVVLAGAGHEESRPGREEKEETAEEPTTTRFPVWILTY